MLKSVLTIKLLVVFLFIFPHIAFTDDLFNLVSSSNWKDLDKGLSIINKNIDAYKDDSLLKEAIKLRLILESKWQKNPKMYRKNWGEGYGEVLMDLLSIVRKLEIKKIEIYYLDWIRNVPSLRKEFANFLANQNPNDMEVFNIIDKRMSSNEEYYTSQKRYYLYSLCDYLRISKDIPKGKKQFIKVKMLNMLESSDMFDRKYAVKCSIHYADDQSILKEINKIAETDPYFRWINNKTEKRYDVRREAKKILRKIKS